MYNVNTYIIYMFRYLNGLYPSSVLVLQAEERGIDKRLGDVRFIKHCHLLKGVTRLNTDSGLRGGGKKCSFVFVPSLSEDFFWEGVGRSSATAFFLGHLGPSFKIPLSVTLFTRSQYLGNHNLYSLSKVQPGHF